MSKRKPKYPPGKESKWAIYGRMGGKKTAENHPDREYVHQAREKFLSKDEDELYWHFSTMGVNSQFNRRQKKKR